MERCFPLEKENETCDNIYWNASPSPDEVECIENLEEKV